MVDTELLEILEDVEYRENVDFLLACNEFIYHFDLNDRKYIFSNKITTKEMAQFMSLYLLDLRLNGSENKIKKEINEIKSNWKKDGF